ncbi:hypothetical protein BD770DRAFT_409908 [Pilaira anomala]|nr:hypothetical protein BD770DRAFT_409908 [Pilaira anomala]
MPVQYSSPALKAGRSPRVEVSLLQPSGKPKNYMAGTVSPSVIYMLPMEYTKYQIIFLEKLRKLYPRERAPGLIQKESSSHHIYEILLLDVADHDLALTTPITLTIDGIIRSFSGFITAPQILYKFHFKKLTLASYYVIKVCLLEAFSKIGEVLDIVLYEDDPSSSWFTGNGYVYLTRQRKYYDSPKLFPLMYPNNIPVEAIWSLEEQN